MYLQKIKKIFKEKIKYFFFSDFIKDYFKKKKFHSNPQANWIGETLINEVSKKDKDFFNKSSLNSKILTVNGVTKSVGEIKNNAKIDISDLDLNKEKIHLSLYAKYWKKNSILKIKINEEEHNYRNIGNIENPSYVPESWFDIALDIKKNTRFIEIECDDETIFIAKPITFQISEKKLNLNKIEKNHIIVIVLDGVVAEFLHNNKKNYFQNLCISPNINEFFKDHFSTKFAFSTCEWTLPGISSFFSGMYTSEHKISKPIGYNYFNEELPSLPETLSANGYKTQFFSTGNRTTPLFGFHRGFDRVFFSHPHGITKSKFNTNDWINSLIDFLNIYKNDKTFSYLHFPNTHQDWMTPGFNNYSFSLLRKDNLGLDLNTIEKEDAENIEKLRIYELDLFLGNLFFFIEKNIIQNTTVIITGDHGSPFFKKYSKKVKATKPDEEKPTLNYRRTNVPFYCRGPSFKEKTYDKSNEQLVSGNIDLSKTILDICNIKSDDFKSGVSIFDKNKRSHLISESIYEGLYEIAVINREFSYFKRSKFDNKKFQIDNSFNKTMFYKTINKYDKNLANEDNNQLRELESIANLHIDKILNKK